jgi:hypothetical protein
MRDIALTFGAVALRVRVISEKAKCAETLGKEPAAGFGLSLQPLYKERRGCKCQNRGE